MDGIQWRLSTLADCCSNTTRFTGYQIFRKVHREQLFILHVLLLVTSRNVINTLNIMFITHGILVNVTDHVKGERSPYILLVFFLFYVPNRVKSFTYISSLQFLNPASLNGFRKLIATFRSATSVRTSACKRVTFRWLYAEFQILDF
jgi:hypothetical protein